MTRTAISQAAEAIADAGAILITAGAGMGVDSGLPDFRGNEGFWRAYPPFAERGLSFEAVADPTWFHADPRLAWGFYGHRLNLYRATNPHKGFAFLRKLAAEAPGGGFVYTSNVDGQFQKAGFAEDQIVERHGSIHVLQCLRKCGPFLFDAAFTHVEVNPETFRAEGDLPWCPFCGGMARPNILMFGDAAWSSTRADAQLARFHDWCWGARGWKGVVIELGAGRSIPTIRNTSQDVAARGGAPLIRINPRDPQVPDDDYEAISIPLGALEALALIQEELEG